MPVVLPVAVISRFASDPALADLPRNLIDEHKVYWNPSIGDDFKNHIGPRGKKSANARTWTREMFIGGFCDQFFNHLSPEQRSDYEAVLGPKVYSYLTNHSSRGTAGGKSKPQVVKQRVYAHDLWVQKNPDAFESALRDHQASNPGAALNVEAEQQKYRQMASDSLETMRALHKLTGDDRTKYIERFMTNLEAILKEGDRCAGIKMNLQVLYEDDIGEFSLSTLVTDSMAELEDSPELDAFVKQIKLWVSEQAEYPAKQRLSMSCGIKAGIPLPACGNRAPRSLPALALAPARGNAGIPGNPANARGIAGICGQSGN
ncbi:hypothetical protein BDV93DRAFT_513527 [Ceratobasidium sp. AG-I]|nr:hypothetical protein BDV93DRAFT_513527 [Ceratobasidium sp. AG-I]